MVIGINKNTKSPVSTVKKNESGGKVARSGSNSSSSRATSSSSAEQSDSVNFTSSATQLNELEKHISSMPVVDTGIVEAVQQKVSTGDYEVDDKSTANKLLTSEKKLASP